MPLQSPAETLVADLPLDCQLASEAVQAIAESRTLALCTLAGVTIESATPGLGILFGAGGGLLGADIAAFAVPDDRAPLRSRLEAFAISGEGQLRLVFRALHASLGIRDVELLGTSTDVAGHRRCLAWLTDRTDQMRAHAQLSYLAYLDALTGMPNRASFTDQLQTVLAGAKQKGRIFALLQIDLDGFKPVNDTYGHAFGDALLQVVGQRIAACSRQGDTAARVGGDEFALILAHVRQPEDAAIVAGRIVRALGEPFQIGERTCWIGASIGVAVYPTHAVEFDALLAAADVAMYAAKRAGRGRYRWASAGEAQAAPSPLLVSWNDKHRVGIAAIDDQHFGLAQRINQLGADMKAGLDLERLLASLEELVQATAAHFAYEEVLMERYEVENALGHIALHRRLLDDVRSLTAGLDERSVVMTMRYLQEWLFSHVDKSDVQLAKALHARGVS